MYEMSQRHPVWVAENLLLLLLNRLPTDITVGQGLKKNTF